jgi:hypothetical protein
VTSALSGHTLEVFPQQRARGVELRGAGRTIGLVDTTADDLEPSPGRLG